VNAPPTGAVPRADDAEASVLGAALLDPPCLDAVAKIIGPADFYDARNRLVFASMLRVREHLDTVTLGSDLERAGDLEAAGGRVYLANLLTIVPSSAHAIEYAKEVQDRATRRRLIAGADDLAEAALNGTDSAIDAATAALASIQSASRPASGPVIYTADMLADLDLPEPRYCVARFLPEGLTILAGAPKIGKSWLALALLLSIALDGLALGRFGVLGGDVLYLALEDTRRRMRKRLEQMLGGSPLPGRLSIAHEWRRSDAGGIEDLARWLKDHPEARLVVIDTAARFLALPKTGKGTKYDADYAAMGPLQSLAAQYGVTILVVTHKRKAEAPDLLETVNGSNGLTGCADTTMILRRERGKADAFLLVTGRDIDEQDLALRFDRTSGLWSVLGDADAFRLGETNERIVDAVRAIGRPATPKEVSLALEDASPRARERTKKALGRLGKAGGLRVLTGGRYGLPEWPGGAGVPRSPASPESAAPDESQRGTRGTPGTTGTRETEGTEGTGEEGRDA
jgi:hypothetical protein